MHIKPKKSLGQNFLVDKNIQNKIIDACGLKISDTVLEIGSGRGELTRHLAPKVKNLLALELDKRLCQLLKDEFRNDANVKIMNRNILKFNLSRYFGNIRDKIKVIGNIPYYITTPIITHLFKYSNIIGTILLTVQKEFAHRIIAGPGSKDYGAFSCFVQYYSVPKLIFTIKKASFLPAPKVDSCFLRMDIRSQPPVLSSDERLFFRIIRHAFNQRRKILKNSLEGVVAPEKIAIFFEKYNIDPRIRPESLGLDDFARLSSL